MRYPAAGLKTTETLENVRWSYEGFTEALYQRLSWVSMSVLYAHEILIARDKMPLRYGWLQARLTASSTKKVLNVPQRAGLRAFLVCILVGAALARRRLEIHFVTRPK